MFSQLKPWAAVADNTRVNPATCRRLNIEFYPCFIHLLQISVSKIINEVDENPLKHILNKVNKIITYFRKSPSASAKLEITINKSIKDKVLDEAKVANKTTLKANNHTRWMSTGESLESFLTLFWPAVRDVLVENDRVAMVLTQAEIKTVEEFVDLLSIPKQVVLELEKEKRELQHPLHSPDSFH